MARYRGILRGAVLGCGYIAPYHLRAWSSIKDVQIVALANRTLSKAMALGREFGVAEDHIYSDYAKLLEKEDLDFVDIATAPQMHSQQVEAAAASGLNVLCQKPFALNLHEARSMISACERQGVLFSINENWRWRSWYREAKRLLEAGVIGQPRYLRIAKHSSLAIPKPDGSPPDAFLMQPYMQHLEKLIVYEWGIHLIDLVRFFLGEVNTVYARTNKISSLYGGEERAVVVLATQDITSLIDISWATVGSLDESEGLFKYLETFVLEGDEGTISIFPDHGGALRVATKSGIKEQPVYDGPLAAAYQGSYIAAHSHFIECLREGKKPETEASDNIKTLAATLAAYAAAAGNRTISL